MFIGQEASSCPTNGGNGEWADAWRRPYGGEDA